MVSEVAGTTRDAIDTPMRYHDRPIVFVDTAGFAASRESRMASSSTRRFGRAVRSSAPTSVS